MVALMQLNGFIYSEWATRNDILPVNYHGLKKVTDNAGLPIKLRLKSKTNFSRLSDILLIG